MAQRMYEDQAEKQRAYRARRKQIAAARVAAGLDARFPPRLTPALQYRAWRKAIAEASALLERTYEEVNSWMQDRSERWEESDRGEALRADYGRLEEIVDTLGDLELLAPASGGGK